MVDLYHPETTAIRLVDVLAALGHPVRMEAVHALADGEERFCGEILPSEPKSSLTHHWRALREAGIIHQRRVGRKFYLTLRRADLDARFPGLLDLALTEPTGFR
ncbi:helix-turn-helix transcriptional regulator [Nocardia ninae]|uniref:Transcriptional regulator n=1 Tax=Nocardia ninae NBRC 108245 TaxID=1210091 RepID=A0A511MPZ6_9NOCA|nr:helix-turn-helix transcriptional regulator [Nocardia ninae]GEM42036.1 transcriptional regulator [Nocardia ninae NBRC 108245]